MHEQFFWQHDTFWRVVDRGQLQSVEEVNADTTLTLLESNSSHLPVIENAIARLTDYAIQDLKTIESQETPNPTPPSILSLVNSAATFKTACLSNALNKRGGLCSSSDDFR